jgi:peroxidase
MNALTHGIDMSNVYGSTDSEVRELRMYQRGLLIFSELSDRKMLLPLKQTKSRDTDYKAAGDDRVNEMQGLMVMHLIWFREHNRVALELAPPPPDKSFLE